MSSSPAAVPVRPIERLNKHLHRLTHLISKLVGDFLLVLGALSQQPFERLLLGHPEEPVAAQQRSERLEGLRLLQPERGIPRCIPGRLALRGIDQHPLVAVRDQPDPHARVVQQLHHPGIR